MYSEISGSHSGEYEGSLARYYGTSHRPDDGDSNVRQPVQDQTAQYPRRFSPSSKSSFLHTFLILWANVHPYDTTMSVFFVSRNWGWDVYDISYFYPGLMLMITWISTRFEWFLLQLYVSYFVYKCTS
jgi:hypothetical protein